MEPTIIELQKQDHAHLEDLMSRYLEQATAHGLTLGKLPRLMDFNHARRGDVIEPVALADGPPGDLPRHR